MALTQVRARLGEEWVVLTLNPASGRYEGELTAGGTSIYQPGGYYPVAVEVANDTGRTETLSGNTYAPLRLLVRETASPALTLISPQPGWLTTGSPALVFEAVDEEGGSGVDPESFEVAAGDGLRAAPSPGAKKRSGTAPASCEPIPGGYRFTWTPPEPWEDGPHMVTASVADRDGNVASVSAAYIVDTAPPVLCLRKPDSHRVVDVDHIQIGGWARDETSGVAEVTVATDAEGAAQGGLSFEAERAAQGGRPYMEFSLDIPLAVGENRIIVTARDSAGLETTQSLWVLRLVTDRTRADVDRLQDLYARGVDGWTAQELEWFNTSPCLRGSYDAGDLNRVGIAVAYLTKWLSQAGYSPQTSPKTDWAEQDVMTDGQSAQYLRNVESIRAQMPVWSPETPGTLRRSTVENWNDIEKILVAVDSFRPGLEASAWQSGNLQCGTF